MHKIFQFTVMLLDANLHYCSWSLIDLMVEHCYHRSSLIRLVRSERKGNSISRVHLLDIASYRRCYPLRVTVKIHLVFNLQPLFDCFDVRSIVIETCACFISMHTTSCMKKRNNKMLISSTNYSIIYLSIERSSNRRFKSIENSFIKLRRYCWTTPLHVHPDRIQQEIDLHQTEKSEWNIVVWWWDVHIFSI